MLKPEGEFWDEECQFSSVPFPGDINPWYSGWPHLRVTETHIWIETPVGYLVLALSSAQPKPHRTVLDLRNWMVVPV